MCLFSCREQDNAISRDVWHTWNLGADLGCTVVIYTDFCQVQCAEHRAFVKGGLYIIVL